MKKLIIAAICSGILIFAPANNSEAAESQVANAVQAAEDVEIQQLRGYGPPPPPPPPPGRYGPPRPGYRPPPPPPPHRHQPPPPPPRRWR